MVLALALGWPMWLRWWVLGLLASSLSCRVRGDGAEHRVPLPEALAGAV